MYVRSAGYNNVTHMTKTNLPFHLQRWWCLRSSVFHQTDQQEQQYQTSVATCLSVPHRAIHSSLKVWLYWSSGGTSFRVLTNQSEHELTQTSTRFSQVTSSLVFGLDCVPSFCIYTPVQIDSVPVLSCFHPADSGCYCSTATVCAFNVRTVRDTGRTVHTEKILAAGFEPGTF